MEKDLLLGALIGLARATDGSEHLRSEEATGLIRRCFLAIQAGESLSGLREEVLTQKQKMVPNCFLCTNPCGRTSDMDLTQLQSAPLWEQTGKMQILEAVIRTAGQDDISADTLYNALIAVGTDGISPQTLQMVLSLFENS